MNSYHLRIVITSRNEEDGFSHKYYILFLQKYPYPESSEENTQTVPSAKSWWWAYECHFNLCVFELCQNFKNFF